VHSQKVKIEYQIMFNKNLMECEENSTAEAFNDLIIQFGYISLFSVAFPPAALFCYACNMITMKSIMSEFKYKQRQLPEISIGIG
jgi:hypothetical protein